MYKFTTKSFYLLAMIRPITSMTISNAAVCRIAAARLNPQATNKVFRRPQRSPPYAAMGKPRRAPVAGKAEMREICVAVKAGVGLLLANCLMKAGMASRPPVTEPSKPNVKKTSDCRRAIEISAYVRHGLRRDIPATTSL